MNNVLKSFLRKIFKKIKKRLCGETLPTQFYSIHKFILFNTNKQHISQVACTKMTK